MIDAAQLADEVAAELRDMPRLTVLDPVERVHWQHRLALKVEEIGRMVRESGTIKIPQIPPKTMLACERRRTIEGPKDQVLIEVRPSRRGGLNLRRSLWPGE